MRWIFLAGAILSEVVATVLLQSWGSRKTGVK